MHGEVMVNYWLMKSELDVYPWSQLVEDKTTHWDGVRNYQARNNLMKMKRGDHAFFYHTGEEKKIVGIVKISKEYFTDKTDKNGKFVSIMVQFYKSLEIPVSLNDIKKHSLLQNLQLLKQSRLSVMSIDSKSWKVICNMGKMLSLIHI